MSRTTSITYKTGGLKSTGSRGGHFRRSLYTEKRQKQYLDEI